MGLGGIRKRLTTGITRKGFVAGAAGIALLASGAASVTHAAIPDGDDGEFHVCVQTNRSVNTQYTMFVIDPPLQTAHNGGCNTGYTHHVLNQQGPPGPQGPQGATGPAGPAGLISGATWITVQKTEPCGQSAPFVRTVLVDLPADKRGFFAANGDSSADDTWGDPVKPGGASSARGVISPEVYHFDPDGRIDGIYLRISAFGGPNCTSSSGTLTARAYMLVYDIS